MMSELTLEQQFDKEMSAILDNAHGKTEEEKCKAVKKFEDSNFKGWLKDKLTWKSVEDGLPKNGKPVIARHRQKKPFVASYYSDLKDWLEPDGSVRCPDRWMEIPE